MKQKSFLSLFTFLVLSILLVGCNSESKESSTKSETSNSDLQTVSKLTVGLPSDYGPMNIYTGNVDYLTDLVYDKLFSPSPYVDKPIPWLAESAEQIDDVTWVVKIRSGIKWHDGEDFTAEDVKFTYEYYRDGPPNRHTHHVSEVPHIEKIELDDESTVRFSCAYACPSLETITFADLPILPKHIWENVENPRKFTELAIGTGPYQLVDYKADQYYTFEANEEYFMGSPVVQTLSMPIIKDSTAMFNALRSGEIDISARTLPAELTNTFTTASNMKVASTSPLSIVELKVDYQKEPFNNELFRKALSFAVDRQSIVDTVLLGQGRAGVTGYPHPDSPWTSSNLSTPFDVEQAKSILKELNYTDTNGDGILEDADGKSLDLSLKVSASEPIYIRVAEMLKTQFADVGINLNVEAIDSATLSVALEARDFDMSIRLAGAHAVADPDQFVMSHYSDNLWVKGLPYPAMDSLIAEWKAEPTIEKRKEIGFKMQELFNSQPTSIALYYPEENYAYNAEVYDQWVESPGYGIINKFSLLGEDVRTAVGATEAQIIQ